MNNKETKKTYEAPALTVVSFKTEQGYAQSMLMLAGSWSGNSGDNADVAGVSNYTEESDNGNYFNW